MSTVSKSEKVSKLDLTNVKTAEDLNLALDGKELTNDEIFSLLDKQVIKVKKKGERGQRESKYNLDNYNTYFKQTSEKIGSKERNKIRKKRDFFINNLLIAVQSKDAKSKKDLINSFKEFYSKVYVINDFTLESIASNNSDADTKNKANLFLQIIKISK